MPPGATRLRVTFEARGPITRVELEHTGLVPSEAAKHAIGWPHFIARLGVTASGGIPGPDPMEDVAPGRRCPKPARSSDMKAPPRADQLVGRVFGTEAMQVDVDRVGILRRQVLGEVMAISRASQRSSAWPSRTDFSRIRSFRLARRSAAAMMGPASSPKPDR